jgi:hypothetical protein
MNPHLTRIEGTRAFKSIRLRAVTCLVSALASRQRCHRCAYVADDLPTVANK